MSTSSCTCPIDALPPELLIEIFTYCADVFGNELPLLTIGRTCQYWRSVANTSPRLWQHLFLSDSRKVEASHTQARLWMANSTPFPLHIHVNVQSPDMLLPLLSPLIPQLVRWSECEINTGETTERTNFAALGTLNSASRLEALRVGVRGCSGIDPLAMEGEFFNSPTFMLMPTSRSDALRDVCMYVAVSTLPMPHHVSAMLISDLTICEAWDTCPDPVPVLQFLTSLPALKQFHYYGVPHQGLPSDASITTPVVVLPQLHTLLLRSTCAVRTFLAHIDAPRLIELYLEHTNVDFPIQYDPYAGSTDDGDSDDEANDFSQSPWSDHATGMGLRALMQRSKPQLEVLEMTYADMRTKDFLWCFEQLNALREFRIVASDMSDTVIQALAPVVSPDQPVRIRLPQLYTLGLWNCNRVSGDALVETLRSRVEFTDVAVKDDLSTLTDIVINGCTRFRPQHALELLDVFGDRFRTS